MMMIWRKREIENINKIKLRKDRGSGGGEKRRFEERERENVNKY